MRTRMSKIRLAGRGNENDVDLLKVCLGKHRDSVKED